MQYLIVVDMQNDFISGSLGSSQAQAIVEKVVAKIQSFPGRVLFTRDTHDETYLQSQEGQNLPVPHCIKNTPGWQLHPQIEALCQTEPIDKPTFGSLALAQLLQKADAQQKIASITLVGLCTDICVIANAMLLKAYLPETLIQVDASCCAGVTEQSHQNALAAMQACQIKICPAS